MIEDLYKRKTIRDYLSLFSESRWKHLIPLTLEYGIMNLRKSTNITSLSLEDLAMMIEDMKGEIEMENKVKKETQHIKETPQREHFQEEHTDTIRARSRSNNNKESKPSADWRKGDAQVFKKKKEYKAKDIETASLNSDIYPKWWGAKNKEPSKEELDKQYNDPKKNELYFEGMKPVKAKQPKKVNNDDFMREERNDYRDIESKKNELYFEGKKPVKTKQPKKVNNDDFMRGEKSDYGDVESKIKDAVARDKRLYQIMNKTSKPLDYQRDYNFQRRNKNSDNVKTVVVPDYRIEYDRNLRPQAIREKSIERKIPIKKQNTNPIKSSKPSKPDVTKQKSKVSFDSDNNMMSDTDGGLSSYAPSERTKNFFVNQFKPQNSLELSGDSDDDKFRRYNKPVFNNYMSQK
jgi:hypothetical protein